MEHLIRMNKRLERKVYFHTEPFSQYPAGGIHNNCSNFFKKRLRNIGSYLSMKFILRVKTKQ